MSKINFKEFKLFKDITQTEYRTVDVSRVFADTLYKNGTGIVIHDLALRIFRSEGGMELDGEEEQLICKMAMNFCTPVFIDSLSANITE